MALTGFVTAQEIQKYRSTMIGLDGDADSGKTELALSAPGKGALVGLDRGVKGLLDNPNPPPTRNPDFIYKIVQVPLASQLASAADYKPYWFAFYTDYLAVLAEPLIRSMVLDGDSDSWELQRLAEFGRITKVPSIMYESVNAARRAMYARAHDARKVFIATSRIRKVYVTKLLADGTPELNSSGNEVRVWNGTYERQGFADQNYLWQIQCRCDKTEKGQFRVTILKCKPNQEVIGLSLVGGDCNMETLLEVCYPNVTATEWGFKPIVKGRVVR